MDGLNRSEMDIKLLIPHKYKADMSFPKKFMDSTYLERINVSFIGKPKNIHQNPRTNMKN